MIDTPLYLYGNAELPSPDDGALFHYTKSENLLKILETMTLRSTPLCKMNDLNEANIDSLNWNQDYMLMIKTKKYVKEQCSIISFSRNYMAGPICEEGSNHPAMWAHYAEDSKGVCLVLDKQSLIANNQQQLASLFYQMEPITYSLHNAPEEGIENQSYSSVSDFIRKNYKELFFKKHVDWSYEDEIRFFVELPEIYLDIKGAIKHIVLGGRLRIDEARIERLIEQIITPGKKSYRYFNMHSFAEIMPTINGYLTDDGSQTIYMQLQKMANKSVLAKEYLKWHDVYYL